MAHFVNAFGNRQIGYPLLNLDAVVTLRKREGEREYGYDCYDKDDHRIGAIMEPPDHSPTVLPNTTLGLALINFWSSDDGECWSERYPIIAWHIEDSYATPITIEELSEAWCIEQQFDGKILYIFPLTITFEKREDAEAHAREYLETSERSKRIRQAKAALKNSEPVPPSQVQ